MSRSALWRQEGNQKERERQADELFQLAVEEGRVSRLFDSPWAASVCSSIIVMYRNCQIVSKGRPFCLFILLVSRTTELGI